MQKLYMYGSRVQVFSACCSASAMSITRARQRMPSSIEVFIVDECLDGDEECVAATEAKVDECVDEDEGWQADRQGGHTDDLQVGLLELEGRTTEADECIPRSSSLHSLSSPHARTLRFANLTRIACFVW